MGATLTTLLPWIVGLLAILALAASIAGARAAIARHWRTVLPRLPLPTLALAASYGVYSFSALFVPQWVAIIQAAAFELTYIGLAAAIDLTPAQRRRAVLVSIAAVVVSVVYNTLAGWFHRQPELLATASPVATLMLAILHGAPLAWVAFYVAQLLLHSEPARRPIVAAQRRALIHRLCAAARTARVEARQLRAQLAQHAAEAAQSRGSLAQLRAELELRARGAEEQLRESERELRELRAVAERARSDQQRAEAEAAQLREESARSGELAPREVARWLAAAGVEGREIARRLGRSESTVRGWVKVGARVTAAAD